MATTQDILAPKMVLKVVSEINPALNPISRLLGMNIGGSNRTSQAGRRFGWDIVNHTRKVATGKAPGQPSERIDPLVIGERFGTFPRSVETIDLLYEKIFNQRQIGGPTTMLDNGGKTYIATQLNYMAERMANLIEFQCAAMLRGSYTYTQVGSTLHHDFTGGSLTVDYQVPAGNKDQLDMLGGGDIITASFYDPETDIPSVYMEINKAMMSLHGYPLRHVLLQSELWQAHVNNDKIQAQAGIANAPVAQISQDESGLFTAKLAALPWLTFHILDHGLNVGTAGTYTDLIEEGHFIGIPDPSPAWCQYIDGSEIVKMGPYQSAASEEKYGFYSYDYEAHDPARACLTSGHNGIPGLYNPNVPVYADVTP